jgi:hypothetical protein
MKTVINHSITIMEDGAGSVRIFIAGVSSLPYSGKASRLRRGIILRIPC